MEEEYEYEFVGDQTEPVEMPKEMLEGLRQFCEYLQKNDVYSCVVGVPVTDEASLAVHSMAVIYHGPIEMEIPSEEKH